MATYVVKASSVFVPDKDGSVTHAYSRGDEVELTDEQAKKLLEKNAVESKADAAKADEAPARRRGGVQTDAKE